MECQSNLKNIALAVANYASSNHGRIPPLEDGRFGWPVALLPYLDNAALYRALQADSLLVEKERQRANSPFGIKVLTCPMDSSNAGQHVGLSYAGNSGWGRFLADVKSGAISELHPHSAEIDWDHDGSVNDDERRLTRATGVFWRTQEDRFQLTFDDVSEGDGQSSTMSFTENVNARNWLSRETLDIGFVVSLDRFTFEPSQGGLPGLNVKLANLGPYTIQSVPRSLPGHSPVPSSHHTGVVNVAYVDGRVEQMNVNIDPRVYLARMTWNGHRHGEAPALQQ